MNIRPGVDQPSVANMVEIIRTNSKRFVDITFQDSSGTPIDIEESQVGGVATGELDLDITDLAGTSIYSENYWPVTVPDTRRIQHTATGKYGLTYGTETGESDTVGTFLANWHARQNTSAENVYATQVLEVVSPRTLSILPSFRLMVDKTVKRCLPEENCFLGYTDSQLLICLKAGLQLLNSYQPYVNWLSVDSFDINRHGIVLTKAAMYQALTAQGLFAIDTDIPSFNDQGHSFVLVHFAGLEQVANRLKAELDKIVPDMKKQYVASGSLGAEVRFNSINYMMLSSMPFGALIKNYSNV